MRRWCTSVVFLVCLVPNAAALQTRHEVWPRLEVYIPLKTKVRLMVTAGSEKSNEGENLQGDAQVAVDYFWKKRWTLRTGFKYEEDNGTGSSFPQQTILLEQNYQRELPHRFVFRDRNREEFRWLNGDFSMRFRNRTQLERAFSLGERSIAPYGSAEIFYDTRFSSFNRYRLIGGAQIRFKKKDIRILHIRRQQVLDVYFLWQEDTRSKTRYVQALGLTFKVYF